ncbi:MAG: hypothetical protein RLO51_20040 [Thalassobaculum sp.]|uniref:hypothetical protein n=1 Tax=Thalassobaculum sp. TaxID=2022740 RepID=UPI0032EFAE38
MVPTRITGRHWLQAVAVRGCLIAAALLLIGCYPTAGSNDVPEPQFKQAVSDGHKAEAKGSGGTAPPLADEPATEPDERESETGTYESACQEAENHGLVLDVCQQWRMAKAAELQAKMTVKQIALSKEEVTYVSWSLGLSAFAALVAVVAILVTALVARKELCAYVYFTPGSLRLRNFFYAVVTTGNSGQTPARQVRLRIQAVYVTDAVMRTNSFPIEKSFKGNSIIAPNHSFIEYVKIDGIGEQDSGLKLKDIEFIKSLNGRNKDPKLYVFAEAAYLDVFGAERMTRASWQYIYATGNVESFREESGYLPAFEFTENNNFIDSDHPNIRARRWWRRPFIAARSWLTRA